MEEERKIKGKILKGIGGFYYILDKDSKVHECKARGRFRKDKITPLPGDNVDFFPQEGKQYGFIEEINERRNQLKRPQVANIDQVIITMATKSPKPDLVLIDKLLIAASLANIKAVICINKNDLVTKKRVKELKEQYSAFYDVFSVSAKTGKGAKKLLKVLKGKTTCFAGQSAVGKSSILNTLFSNLDLETGGLSKKTERGKHTTRHAELLLLKKVNGIVVDTPGFSLLDTGELEPEDIGLHFPEIKSYIQDCKFSSCLHKGEPDCAVKEALDHGKINQERYKRYLKIIKDMDNGRNKRYD
jgi:ribosome biogenesis GTPase / thiamine phosphate phosphatase